MNFRRARPLLLILFLLSLGGEALHTLHAHHDGSHCSVCAFQSHNVGTDTHPVSRVEILFIPQETPPLCAGLASPFVVAPTHFGRAPPLSHL